MRYQGCTHGADGVAGGQGADEAASGVQHGAHAGGRGVELLPDGAARGGDVGLQQHRQQAGDVDRHARHGARTLPGEREGKAWLLTVARMCVYQR